MTDAANDPAQGFTGTSAITFALACEIVDSRGNPEPMLIEAPRVKCPNCCANWPAEDISREGLCPLCLADEKDVLWEQYISSQRPL